MKKREKKKLFDLNLEELRKKIDEERKKLIMLKMEKETGKLKDLHAYAKKRKEIATLLTLAREKELKS